MKPNQGHNDKGLADALSFLSSRCDGGKVEDRKGFNSRDSAIGRSLAQWGREKGTYTTNQRMVVKKLVWRYRKQLEQAGYDVLTLVDKRAAKAHAG